jgi:hypothetical protein
MTSLVLILFSAELVAEELKFTNGIHSYKADSFFRCNAGGFQFYTNSNRPD